jgi:hypothetical protein
MALSRFVLTADTTVAWPGALVTAPAVPASTVAQFNAAGVPVVVTVIGGTVTVIAVNGTATGLTAGAVVVPAGGTITLTYSVAPTWTWAPYGAMAAGIQSKFIRGTVIYADSAGGSSGPAQLYAAIGAGNLRAWTDTDAPGHAGLAN